MRDLLSRNQPTGYIGEIRQELPRGLSLGTVDAGSPDQYGNFFDGVADSDDAEATDEHKDTEEDR